MNKRKSNFGHLLWIIGIIVLFQSPLTAQESDSYEFSFEINQVFAPLSISYGVLDTAITIEDLNPYYKSSWVKEFESVSISTIHDGKIRKANNQDDVLTQEQLNNLKTADIRSDITIELNYIPDNTLSHNESKTYDFTFTINPNQQAEYPGGREQFDDYINEKITGKISDANIKIHNVRAVQFTIDESGQVVDAHIPDTPSNFNEDANAVDSLMMHAICNMPKWKPATYDDGTKVDQEFVLTAGDHRSCTLNLLNIRRLPPEGQ